MRLTQLILLTSVTLCSLSAAASAEHRSYSYPKVRTFSGGYYGPTQAHYQYQRRYGRPWHGQGGLSANYSVGVTWAGAGYGGFGFSPAYGSGFGGLGYSSYYVGPRFDAGCAWFSPWVSYPLGVTVVQPALIPQYPGIFTPLPTTNPLAAEALLNNGALLQQQIPDLLAPNIQQLGVAPVGVPDVPLPVPSTPEARLRSLQLQQDGDLRLHNLQFQQASLRYQDAIKAAGERVEPHYRLGTALAGMKRFDQAVQELKTATAMDPSWVNTITLNDLLGDDHLIGKTQLKQRVAEWALADAYDADRLYLLGTLLYLDGDPDRAQIMFDTAVALVGQEPHLTAFRTPPAQASDQRPGPVPDGPPIPRLPPVPEAVDPPPPAPTPTDVSLPGVISLPKPSLKQPVGPVFPSSF